MLLLACLTLGASAPDPGITLLVDRERFQLRAIDRRDGASGPHLPVALGSPAHPTPRGNFALERVVSNPAWTPGATARANGAEPMPPSRTSPMGVAKIPFSEGGPFALHGGAIPLLLGKPISAGCVRTAAAFLLDLLAWLRARGALGSVAETPHGEQHQRFLRPVRLDTR
jgi:hypothetical protein